MVAYSFQKRFVRAIELGRKTQTIRLDGKRRHAGRGDHLQLYYAMRTKRCRLIVRAICTARSEIVLVFTKGALTCVLVAGAVIHDLQSFAVEDGFRDEADMAAFWATSHGMIDGIFRGVLIKWSFEPVALAVAA